MLRWLVPLALIFALVGSTGCGHFAGFVATAPPNRIVPPAIFHLHEAPVQFDYRYTVMVGPPEAKLDVAVLEPRVTGTNAVASCALGTIIVLHGSYGDSVRMYPFSTIFARAGYRTVFVDMRGHGQSTGNETTFGVFESRDLSQVLDDLGNRGLLVGNIGVCGHSLGGSIAIQWASRDPRIRSVVAMAPHACMAEILRQTILTRVPVVRRVASEEWIQRVIREAGRSGRFDPREANALAAMRTGTAPILLMHGMQDQFVYPYHSQLLYHAAPHRAELLLLHQSDHTGMLDEYREYCSQVALSYFQRTLFVPVATN